MLSHVRQGTERTATIFNELGEAAQNEEIKKVLQARAFVSEKTIEKLDEAFRLLGEQPVKRSRQTENVPLHNGPIPTSPVHWRSGRVLPSSSRQNHSGWKS